MKTLLSTLLISVWCFGSTAFADHRTDPLGVAEGAEDLAAASGQLEASAGFKFRLLSRRAQMLAYRAESFHHVMEDVQGEDHSHLDVEQEFQRVELDFWLLARTWNRFAHIYSQDQAVLLRYNQVVAVYRDLLLTFYGIEHQ